ncbi:MAG: orotidine-5'-phosphate decarboxylase [Planctomycetota bacterium]|jgi:orotidine-5'-phosphate decarboxylase
MNFADRLTEAVLRKENPSVVGLDPNLERLPAEYAAARDPQATRAERATAVGDFLCRVVDLVEPHVAAVKPQSAYFEALGADGVFAWERVVAHAKDAGLLVVGDVKRGDIGSTATAYATAFLTGIHPSDEAHLCDAITLNPYLGSDAIKPFVDACKSTGRGSFILVRTSNPSSQEFQLQGKPTLAELVARAVHAWGSGMVGEHGLSSIGAVVGATHPETLAAMRTLMPHALFLLPGYGAQGGTAAGLSAAFTRGLRGALVNSSRGILYAYQTDQEGSWEDATTRATLAMKADLKDAVETCA